MYELFLANQQKPIHKWLHYFPIYERHFSDYKNKALTMYKIGVFKGGSLQLWKKYFGPFATIVGIDIDPRCKDLEEPQINIRIGDQSDTTFLQTVFDEFGPPDIVLDDGSHQMDHVNTTFDFLYGRMKDNGIYLIEDTHTAYLPDFGGGLNKADTIIEKSKSLIDQLNAYYCGLPTTFADSTFSIAFYDSVIVFEKRKWPKGIRIAPEIPGEHVLTVDQLVQMT